MSRFRKYMVYMGCSHFKKMIPFDKNFTLSDIKILINPDGTGTKFFLVEYNSTRYNINK